MNSPDVFPAETPQEPFLDHDALNRLQDTLGSQADIMIPVLLDDFFKDSVRLLTDARRALEQKNISDLRRHAHTLKSNGATFGAMALSAAAKELESLAKQEILEGASALLDKTAREYEKIKPLLEQFRKGF